MEIYAKSNKLSLREHTEDVLKAIDKLPYGKLNIPDLKTLLSFAVFFHDLGKVSPKFQERMGNESFEPKINDFPDIRHNIFSLFFINKEKVKEICNNDEALYTTFLSAIAFHHWKVDEKEYLLNINEDLKKASELLLKEGYCDKLATILKEHFGDFCIDGYKAEDLISFDEHLARHLEKDGSLLSTNIIPPYTLYFLPERLRLEMQMKINLNLWVFLSGFLMRVDHFISFVEKENKISLYEVEKNIPGKRINEILKQKFGENFWQKEANNLKDKNLILIAPTGIGKTEFAFLWAEGEKFFYTLPIRVATNQMFERACDYFNETQDSSEDPFINENIGLLHSDADLYLLEKSEIYKKEEEGETPRIFDLSRYFSLPVNICTGDQIFPAGLKYPQYEKIYATLGYSKLIIDEVQAYDPKACAIVVRMIEDIVSLGGKFLLMTATLPKFVKDYLEEKNVVKDEEVIDCYKDDNKIGIKINTGSKHKIELKNKDIAEDVDEIINKANEGKRVLVVLNTIDKAKEIYNEILKKSNIKNDNIFLDLIHSRFTLNERRKKEKEIEEKFKNPKPEEEKEPKILVSTQVVEASLDIDADYLFTEIAPIDSLIQRMGRVMRRVDILTNKIKNIDEEFDYDKFYPNLEPNVYIYYTQEKDSIIESGKGRVYEKELLSKTLDALKNKTEIKEKEKQKLVEEVYSNPENSKYINKFYETIRILNSGYCSENKEEAHKLFREIYTISLVDEEKVNEIKQKIVEEINQNKDITWLWFKKDIIAEYVINDNMWRYKEHQLEPLSKELLTMLDLSKELKEKINRYCEGIWIPKKSEYIL
ncbi:MAG: CRISPR-associated helicase Cas3' [Candidatus Ratteibacteria bacterium]